MDYIVADRVVLPESLRPFFTEEPLYLPGCYQIHDPLEASDGLPWTRAHAGLPPDAVVFCVINQPLKIDPETYDDWMAILRAVPNGCLWIYRENPWVPRHLRREAEARGVDSARLVFADAIPKPSHLSRLRLADLFLDTYRCNAHTAARDALAAGLPLITRPGDGFASRVAASLLTALGLEDLIAVSRDEYVATAIRLGLDPAERARYKTRVAKATASSAWRDLEGYVRQLEAAFEEALERKTGRHLSTSGKPQPSHG
ncbi:protein O-GlcNAc transferase [Gammaproteobacteria bacterium]